MKPIKSAFTFVELIVVITIMAILATIGFSVYQSYLESSRDTNRVVQLSEISDGFEKLSLSARLPFPESMVEIQVWSGTVKTFAYQGFAGEKVMQAIGYVWWGQDPESSLYPSYMLSESRKDFQLMTFIKDAKLLSAKNLYANTQFEKLFPKVEGSPLGILLEQETQIPLQLLPDIQTSWAYNITTGTGNLIAYFEDKKTLLSSQWLQKMLPNSSCKRIFESWKSNWNGIYILNITGTWNTTVYCNMTTQGGGWTLVARSVSWATWNFWWLVSRWNVRDDTTAYSLWSDIQKMNFWEMLVWIYTSWKDIWGAWYFSEVNQSLVPTASNTFSSWQCQLITGNPILTEGCYTQWGVIPSIARYNFNWSSSPDPLTNTIWLRAWNFFSNKGWNTINWKQAMIFVR